MINKLALVKKTQKHKETKPKRPMAPIRTAHMSVHMIGDYCVPYTTQHRIVIIINFPLIL